MTYIEQVNHMAELPGVAGMAADPAAVVQISFHREMWKQPAFLEDIADAPPPSGHIDTGDAVKENLVAENDTATFGL